MNRSNELAVAVDPRVTVATTGQKTRYSDCELEEFKKLIIGKLEEASFTLEELKGCFNSVGNDTVDTFRSCKGLEDGADCLSRESLGKQIDRQQKHINSLNAALMRIHNKTYGICRETGKLISKERLRAVPHATLCIESKESTAKMFKNQKN